MQERIRRFIEIGEISMDRILEDDLREVVSNKELFFKLNNKTVLVTGATGLIGSMLIKCIDYANKLYGYNTKIIGQIRNIEKAKEIYGEFYKDILFVTESKVRCDYIIHTVSPTKSKFFIENPVETIKSSVLSTIDVLDLAKENNASIVYLSSMEQYGIPYEKNQIMNEDVIGIIDHLNIRSSYSESKRLCECLCVSYAKEYDVDVKIARLAQTFGVCASKEDNRMPIQFARAVVEEKNIILHTEGKSIINFVYLTDAILGILLILENGDSGETYNVCNDNETRSVREIAELVSKEIALSKIDVQIDVNENLGYAPDVAMFLDSSKLKRLGWNPHISMKTAYERLVNSIYDKKNQ